MMQPPSFDYCWDPRARPIWGARRRPASRTQRSNQSTDSAELAAELGGLGEMEALQDDGKIMATGMFNNYPIIINIRICLYLQYLMITVIFWELPIMIISITISDSCVPISVAIWGCIHLHPF